MRLRHARRASEIDPVSPLIGTLEGQFLSYHGEHDAAIRKLRETISLEPRFWLSNALEDLAGLPGDLTVATTTWEAVSIASATPSP